MDMKEEVSLIISVLTLLGMIGSAAGIYYRLKFTTEQLKTTNEEQNVRIAENSRAAQKANDGILDLKTEILQDNHKNEENFSRLEHKVDAHGEKIADIAAAIKEEAVSRDHKLEKILLAISSRNGGKSDV